MLTIQDYKAGNPQTQTFTYDALDRLTSAVASGGSGGTYSLQNYTYSAVTGNLSSKAGVNYTYGDANHDHAVTNMGSNSYSYDSNGNQITRTVGGNTCNLTYDAENRLVGVSGAATATFVYDGDGNRIKAQIGTNTTTYVGNYFEWTGDTNTMKSYYYAGATRVAMRTGTSQTGTVYYLLGDHLGSLAITATSTGSKYAETRYYPWGTERYNYGTSQTTYHFTGQRLESTIGLYYYGARWYDPAAGRFIQPDSIVPNLNNPLDWDRYQYVRSNPLLYIDPSGNTSVCGNSYSDPECEGERTGALSLDEMIAQYEGLSFSGDWSNTHDLAVAMLAIERVGKAFMLSVADTAANAFMRVFGKMEVEAANYSCEQGCWGKSISSQHIRFYKESIGKLDPRLVVHEIGHSFNGRVTNAIGQQNSPYHVLEVTQTNDADFPKRDSFMNGFYDEDPGWEQSKYNTPGEEFADMFIGWTYNVWQASSAGLKRSDWMTQPGHMFYWILMASSLPR